MTGDQQDILTRLKALLPDGWFTDSTPVLDALLNGIAWALAMIYGLADYAKLQTRISTATDGFLDLISFDYFGLTLPRKSAESDDAYRSRILAALFPERATRHGMIRTLEKLTGRTPRVFEPERPGDTGGYNTNSVGYGVAGGYGSLLLPFQAFVTAYRPTGSGIPNIAGYRSSPCGYSIPSEGRWSNISEIVGNVTDADIYSAIDAAKPAGTRVWVAITN